MSTCSATGTRSSPSIYSVYHSSAVLPVLSAHVCATPSINCATALASSTDKLNASMIEFLKFLRLTRLIVVIPPGSANPSSSTISSTVVLVITSPSGSRKVVSSTTANSEANPSRIFSLSLGSVIAGNICVSLSTASILSETHLSISFCRAGVAVSLSSRSLRSISRLSSRV